MDAIHIRGGNALLGETKIQGSKNAVLPVMAAALLIGDITVIENCPRITDVNHMQKLLAGIGCKVNRTGRRLTIDARQAAEDSVKINFHTSNLGMPQAEPGACRGIKMAGESVTGIRSSIMLLGALLGRIGEAVMVYPGGCTIGERPIDLHLNALRKMGVVIREEDGFFTAKAKNLAGAVVELPFPSVGATENVILAAVKAKGVTVLKNAAREPEITTLCSFLKKAGAVIEGAGGSVLVIQGGNALHGVSFRIPPDRIVAGTYLFSVLGAGGHIFLRDAPVEQMRSMLKTAVEMGAEVSVSREGLSVLAEPEKKPVGFLRTEVFPGFPTDMQSPLMAALTTAEGISTIEETIFEDRFHIVEQLKKMGADIRTEEKRAVITGVAALHGCEVWAQELRGGAALVIAGCMADGETIVRNRHFIERGYEDICKDYQNLGVNIVTG